jgi:hypothetical protein
MGLDFSLRSAELVETASNDSVKRGLTQFA